MTTPTMSPPKSKIPLGERSSNLRSPVRSPSKVPLPPSPVKQAPGITAGNTAQALFADESGPMNQMFKASTLSQKPEFTKKISEAHSSGQTYVSPSDDILSPATKKLSEVKGKRFGKSTSLYRSSNLFARPSSQPGGSSGGGGTKS